MSSPKTATISSALPRSRPGGRSGRVAQSIYAATLDLLVDGGFSSITFQGVAERAGVGRATLYRRWTNPAALVTDAIATTAAEHVTIPNRGNLNDDLRQLLQNIADYISGPFGRASLIASLSLGEFDPLPAESEARWALRWLDVAPIFDRAKARGELFDDTDSEMCFALVAGALYFRILIMRQPIDEAWILRTLQTAHKFSKQI